MGSNKLSYEIKQNKLSGKELEFIQACLLGDGSLSKSGKYYRLRIAHQLKHKEYVLWKYNYLKQICASPPAIDRINNSYRFGTVGHKDITQLRNLWYRSIKQIPPKFRLTNLALAIWLMDDGSRIHNTVNFSVHNFSIASIHKLQKLMKLKKIETTIHSDGKGSRLYIQQGSYPIFKRLVTPYIVKCMAYKLP